MPAVCLTASLPFLFSSADWVFLYTDSTDSSLPEPFWSQFDSLPLWPHRTPPSPRFCLSNRPSCALLSLLAAVSCFQRSTGQTCPVGLFLQPDGSPHHCSPSAGPSATLWPQLAAAISTMAEEYKAHSDSMSPLHLRTRANSAYSVGGGS